MGIESYKELRVWQQAMDLVVATYRFTSSFPTEERFGLTSQIRRSVISIPSNIAEGSRRGRKEYARFVGIAYGSGAELETQMEIAIRLGFGDIEEAKRIMQLLGDVMKMLNGLTNSLNTPDTRLTTHDSRL